MNNKIIFLMTSLLVCNSSKSEDSASSFLIKEGFKSLILKPISYALGDILKNEIISKEKAPDYKKKNKKVSALFLKKALVSGAPSGAIRRLKNLAIRLNDVSDRQRLTDAADINGLLINMEFISSYPWKMKDSSINFEHSYSMNSSNFKDVFDKNLPGMDNVADKLIDHCVALKPESSSVDKSCAKPIPIICIVGPEGLNTSWVASLVPFSLARLSVSVAFGPDVQSNSVNSEGGPFSAIKEWHPGYYANVMKQVGIHNPFFIIEGIDELSFTVATDLARIFDTSTLPVDNYLGAAPNISNVSFIATATDPWKIHPDLRDRMEFIHIKDYSDETKILLVEDVLSKRTAKMLGIPDSLAILPHDVVVEIVKSYSNEIGTGNISKSLSRFFTKIKREKDETGVWPEVDVDLLHKFLGEPAVAKEDLQNGGSGRKIVPAGDRLMDVNLDDYDLSSEARYEAEKDVERIKNSMMGHERVGSMKHLEWILSLSWKKADRSENFIDLKKSLQILDEDHFGLHDVKDRILDHLAVSAYGGNTGMILCLVGHPGVGKTSIAKSIAKCLDRKFERAALGGVWGESAIRGWERSYSEAAPGKIIKAYRNAGTNNPVILLDEIDKLCSSRASQHGDPAAALLEVLDPHQNHKFVDSFLGIPFDLSRATFIVTANNAGDIPDALRDRLEIIDIAGYVQEEKLEIAKRHLIPRVKKSIEALELFDLSDEVLKVVIKNYTAEPGVRDLERQIKRIAERQFREQKESGVVPALKIDNLSNYLGAPVPEKPDCASSGRPGVVNGLTWSVVGGGRGYVQTVLSKGKGKIISTGKLGEVLKESVALALGYIKSNSEKLGIESNVFEKTDFHVHMPSGSVPKEGPSAGITMTTSIVSALTGRPCRSEVAMTGEIDLLGNIWPIGGLREKLLAAKRVGVKKVFVPIGNRHDVELIEKQFLRDLEIVFVSRAEEVLNEVLLPKTFDAAR